MVYVGPVEYDSIFFDECRPNKTLQQAYLTKQRLLK